MVAVTGGKAACMVKWLSPHEIWLMLLSKWEGGASKSPHVPAPGSPPCSAHSTALAKDCHRSETRVYSWGHQQGLTLAKDHTGRQGAGNGGGVLLGDISALSPEAGTW